MKQNHDAQLFLEFLKNLSQQLSPDQIFSDPADSWCYSYDNGQHKGLPLGVVFPKSTQDVQYIIQSCNQFNIPVTARGRGTGTPGGAVPSLGGIVISFEKMDAILECDFRNRTLVAQTGCLNQAVQSAVQAEGYCWIPDPGSSAYCTIGGNIAYNAGGPKAVKYGSTRDHVLGLTAVTGTGEIIHTGGYTTKSAAGYDLTRLLIGSEGTLAIITEAILKLTPLPDFKNTLQVVCANRKIAVNTALKIMSQHHLPCALEFLDNTSVQLLQQQQNFHNNHKNTSCLLLINVDSPLAKSEALHSLHTLKSSHPTEILDIQCAETEADINKLWSSRKLLSQALRTLSPKKINEDVVVPISQVNILLDFLDSLHKKYAIRLVTFGHIGNGNLHVNFLIDEKTNSKHINACLSELFEKVIQLNGTLSGEHGIGLEKKAYLPKAVDEATLDIMKKIKSVFDPKNILNPGKIF